MKIEINNSQAICRPDIMRIKKLVQLLMARAVKLDPAARWGEISLVLTDDDGIRPLKSHYFKRNEATDVISLRYDPLPGDGQKLTGELFVNVQRALLVAEKARPGWNASRELALYLAHGCDHLMNSTDDDAAGYRQMRRRELTWLKDKTIARVSNKLFSIISHNRTSQKKSSPRSARRTPRRS